jgi:hypothetical protein
MDSMPRDLILVSFPHQLLHAIAALRMERLRRGIAVDDPLTVWVWSYQAKEHLASSRFRSLFSQMLKGLPEARLSIPGYLTRQWALCPQRSVTDRARYLAKHLVTTLPRLVVYSHDVGSDHTAQALLQAARVADAICFGDPPGFIYSQEEIHRSAAYRPSLMRQLFRNRLSSDACLDWRFADISWVAVDFARGAETEQAPGPPTRVIPLEVLRQTLQLLLEGVEQRASLQQRVLAQFPEKCVPRLLLLSNFTESRMTSRSQELLLYGELIRQYARPDDWVLVKPHAGTSPSFVRRLVASLAGYRLSVLPSALSTLPVEMLDEILKRCDVISVSSASALLTLLDTAASVTHGLTDALIEQYFAPEWVVRFQVANQSILKAVGALRIQAQLRGETAEKSHN